MLQGPRKDPANPSLRVGAPQPHEGITDSSPDSLRTIRPSPDGIKIVKPMTNRRTGDWVIDTSTTTDDSLITKSIKVYEIDAVNGIEECPELEKECIKLLADMRWRDIQLQFGHDQIEGNLSTLRRLRFEAVLDIFALADYQLVDVTVSEESLQFVIDHCYEKKSKPHPGKKGTNEAKPGESGSAHNAEATASPNPPPDPCDEKVKWNCEESMHSEQENLCGVVLGSSPPPGLAGQVEGTAPSHTRAENSSTQERPRRINTGSDSLEHESRYQVGYFAVNNSIEFEDRNSAFAQNSGNNSTNSTILLTHQANRLDDGLPTEAPPATPVDPDVAEWKKRSRHGLIFDNGAANFGSLPEDSQHNTPYNLSRMQKIFASRRHNSSDSQETGSVCSERTTTDYMLTQEYLRDIDEHMARRTQEQWVHAANMIPMSGRYPLGTHPPSSEGPPREWITEVDPELLAWMTKEPRTVKVRRDSAVSLSAQTKSMDDGLFPRASVYFSDSHFGLDESDDEEVASLLYSPQHSFSEAALAIALREPGPTRLNPPSRRRSWESAVSSLRISTNSPGEIVEHSEKGLGYTVTHEAIVNNETKTSSALSNPKITCGVQIQGGEDAPNGEIERGMGREIGVISCALNGVSLGSTSGVPCQLCMTDQDH